jgi:ankyrin repeat protein
MRELDERLSKAAMDGRVEEVRALLAAGAAANAKAETTQWTSLHYAASGGHADVCQILLEAGAAPAARDAWGDEPMHLAAMHGHVACCKLLNELDSAYAPGDNNHGYSPWHRAAAAGRVEVCAYLLSRAPHLIDIRRGNQTALHLCTNNVPDFHRLVRLLIDAGANLDKADALAKTPLWYCAHHGHLTSLNSLLEAGARITGSANISPLEAAAKHGHLDVARRLVEAGAVPADDLAVGDLLCGAAESKNAALVHYLIASSGLVDNVDAPGTVGESALQRAAKSANGGVVSALLALGANRDQRNADDQTIEEIALANRRHDVVAAIRAHEAREGLRAASGARARARPATHRGP